MKRTCLLGLLLFTVMMVGAHTIRSITLDYSEKDFTFHTNNGLTFISSNVYATSHTSEVSSPALPLISVKILIGPNESVAEYSISSDRHLAYDNIALPHNLPFCSTNERLNINPLEEVEFSKEVYPDSLVQYFGVHTLEGYKYAEFMCSPFTYNTKLKALFIHKISITLSIEKEADNRLNDARLYKKSALVSKMVVNPEDVGELYSVAQSPSQMTMSNSDIYDYVIVTSDSLKDIFQELANWKTQKGMKGKVITVEDIYAQYTTNENDCIKIKRALQDYYRDGQGCKYILLGGDINVVPAYKCYVQLDNAASTNGSAIRHNSTVTDLFYSSFSNLDWNTNGNLRNGELSDSIDPSPSVSIGRIPVTNRLNARAITHRIIDYEKGRILSKWKNNILMFGGGLDDDFIYMPYKSTAHYFCDTIYKCDIESHGIERFRFYDTDSDYPEGAFYDLNKMELQSEMEKGYHFIYGDTHGFTGSWSLEASAYLSENASHFNNPINSHIITNACFSNDLTSTNCLSKAFMENPNSGLLSYFGSSVENWICPFPFWFDYSEFISHTYFHTLFKNNTGQSFDYKRLGEIVKAVKDSVIIQHNINTYSNPYRWLLFSMNLLGDPEMPIFTSTPILQDGIECSFTNGVLNIASPFYPGDLGEICITSLHDYGQSYYYKNTIAYNSSYSLPHGEYCVCITHPGHIPYIHYIGDNLYVQNETISGFVEISGNDVNIGSNVTNAFPHGSVIIENGSAKINTGNQVTIKNSFEVKKGASLYIQTSN